MNGGFVPLRIHSDFSGWRDLCRNPGFEHRKTEMRTKKRGHEKGRMSTPEDPLKRYLRKWHSGGSEFDPFHLRKRKGP